MSGIKGLLLLFMLLGAMYLEVQAEADDWLGDRSGGKLEGGWKH